MANEFVIKKGFHSKGDSNITGSLDVQGTGSFDVLIGDGSGITGVTVPGVLSGSAQISSDISGSFTEASGGLAGRITTLETTSSGFWTGSASSISREGDVQITGSLTVNGNTTANSGSFDYITLQSDGTHAPRMYFSGSTSSPIYLEVESDGTVAFKSDNSGSLWRISDSLSGSLFNVAPASGLPILEVFSSERVVAGANGKETLDVRGTDLYLGSNDFSGSNFIRGNTEITGSVTVLGNITAVSMSGDGSGLTGTNGIYGGNGSLSGSTVVTMGSNDLQFTSAGSANHLFLDASSGRVGIGTTLPLEALDVQNSYFRGPATFNDALGAIEFKNAPLGFRSVRIDYVNGLRSYVNNDPSQLIFLSNKVGNVGNFGIGTDDPTAKLHVSGGAVLFEGAVTGSSFSGSFQGDGSGLTNIDFTGLSLSQISSGSATASISPNSGLQINTGVGITGSLILHNFGGSTAGGSSIVTGFESFADNQSLAVGGNVSASGQNSVAFGELTRAQPGFSFAQGYKTLTEVNPLLPNSLQARYAHAEGWETSASAYAAHAEGYQTQAGSVNVNIPPTAFGPDLGRYSHAEGWQTKAFGGAAHAEGYQSQAGYLIELTPGFFQTRGNFSHTEGQGTIASGSYQHAQGKYNTYGNDTSLMIIGNGTDDLNRSDLALFNSTGIIFNQPLTASIISGSFQGDGSNLTGVDPFPFTGEAQISGSLLIANQADPADRYFRAYGQSGDYSIYIDEQRQVSGRAQLYVGAQDKGFTDGNPVVSGYNNVSSSISLYTDRGIYVNGTVHANAVSASQFSGSFVGDGSGLTGIEYTSVLNKPTLVSGSSQISYNGITDVPNGIVSSSVQTLANVANGTVPGNLTVSGDITAENWYVTTTSSSVIYQSGSTKFGDTQDDTHTFTGSLFITGSANFGDTTSYIGAVGDTVTIADDQGVELNVAGDIAEWQGSALTLTTIDGPDGGQMDFDTTGFINWRKGSSPSFGALSSLSFVDSTLGYAYQLPTAAGTIALLNNSGSGDFKASGSFSGSFQGDGSGLTNIVSSSYALSSSYAGDYLPLAGGTMTGILTLQPGNAMDLVDGAYINLSTDKNAGLQYQPAGNGVVLYNNTSSGSITLDASTTGQIDFEFDNVKHMVATTSSLAITASSAFRFGNVLTGVPTITGDIKTSALTANQTWTLPDNTGTIALLSDVTGSTFGYSGSFSGSFQGDGSGLTGVVSTATLQTVTDNGNSTTNDINITGSLRQENAFGSKFYITPNPTSTVINTANSTRLSIGANNGPYLTFNPASTTTTSSANFVPGNNVNVDLGSPTRRWANVYGANISGSFQGDGFGLTDVPVTTTNILWVSTTGNNLTAQKGNVQRPWLSISASTAAASVGDSVIVEPGTYIEPPFTVSDGVTLKSLGSLKSATISASNNSANFITQEANTRLEGFTVVCPSGSFAGIYYDDEGAASIYDVTLKGTGNSIGFQISQSTATISKVIFNEFRYGGGDFDKLAYVQGGILAADGIHVPGGGSIDKIFHTTAGRLQAVNTNAGNKNVSSSFYNEGGTNIILGTNLFNVQEAFHLASQDYIIQGMNVYVDDNVGKHITIDAGISGSDSSIFNIVSGHMQAAKVTANPDWVSSNHAFTFQDDGVTLDPAFRVYTDLEVGHANKGFTFAAGEGLPYNKGMKIINSGSTGFTDVTTAAISRDSSTFVFTYSGSEDAMYFGNTQKDPSIDDLYLYFTGLQYKQVSTGSYSIGDLTLEIYTTASTWEAINGAQCVSTNEGYNYANNIFTHDDSEEEIIADVNLDVWATASFFSTEARWGRIRLINPIATSPVFEQFIYTPNSTIVNPKGQLSFRGKGLSRITVPIVGNTWGDDGLANPLLLSIGADVTWQHRIMNTRLNSTGDAAYNQLAIPAGVSTAFPMNMKISFRASAAETAQVDIALIQQTGVKVNDPAGGKIPTARTTANTTDFDDAAVPITSFTVSVPNTNNTVEMFELTPVDLSSFYEGDLILIRVTNTTANGNLDIVDTNLTFVKWTLGERQS